MRKQQSGETAPFLIMAIHKVAETCEYDALREDFIIDRLVVGISDDKLSEKFHMMTDLTLERLSLQYDKLSRYTSNRELFEGQHRAP